MSYRPRRPNLLAIIGPGMIVAATGVGAGDLATGAFTGSKLGVAVLWAVVLGATFKFTVNEGLARWQLVTGTTLLEGVATHFGRWAIWPVSRLSRVLDVLCRIGPDERLRRGDECRLPLGDSPEMVARGKIIYGIAHSVLTVVLMHVRRLQVVRADHERAASA